MTIIYTRQCTKNSNLSHGFSFSKGILVGKHYNQKIGEHKIRPREISLRWKWLRALGLMFRLYIHIPAWEH